MDIIKLATELSKLDWLQILGAISAILSGLIIIFQMIPGDQPEKTLRAIVNLIAKFSRK
jgi:hypothetical protein